MVSSYMPAVIEAKWQRVWTEQQLYRTKENIEKPPFYVLSLPPYPSGNLHIGHVRSHIIADVVARVRRMQDYRVLFPVGWDGFGLPAENAAAEHKIHPANWIAQNIERMKAQLKQLGLACDWERELVTCSPHYYKWTQWIFMQLLKAGLAYTKEVTVNWDPVAQITLFNEQVDSEGNAWGSGARVEQRRQRYWYLKISEYAEELLQDLAQLSDWPEQVRLMQANWIGRSTQLAGTQQDDSDDRNEGRGQASYRLRDWLISRHRYWGVPIPMVHCPCCGVVPVPDEQLPVKLPETLEWSEQGLRPLTSFEHWIAVPCPNCGTPARRETDTLDTFVDSSWYFLRFTDVWNEAAIFEAVKVNNWLPVDLYVCPTEQAVLHLLYARFLNKALRDRGLFNSDEPFRCLLNQGTVQNITYRNPRTRQYIPKTDIVDRGNPVDPQTGDALDITYERMLLAKYNSIAPQGIVAEYGADALRLFILSEVPPQMTLVWDEAGVERHYSFLHQVWQVVTRFLENRAASISSNAFDGLSTAERELQQVIQTTTIQTISQAVQGDYQLNVAVSELLELNNTLTNTSCVNSSVYAEGIDTLVKLLAPFAPHIAEELWHCLGNTESIHCQPWPSL